MPQSFNLTRSACCIIIFSVAHINFILESGYLFLISLIKPSFCPRSASISFLKLLFFWFSADLHSIIKTVSSSAAKTSICCVCPSLSYSRAKVLSLFNSVNPMLYINIQSLFSNFSSNFFSFLTWMCFLSAYSFTYSHPSDSKSAKALLYSFRYIYSFFLSFLTLSSSLSETMFSHPAITFSSYC